MFVGSDRFMQLIISNTVLVAVAGILIILFEFNYISEFVKEIIRKNG